MDEGSVLLEILYEGEWRSVMQAWGVAPAKRVIEATANNRKKGFECRLTFTGYFLKPEVIAEVVAE